MVGETSRMNDRLTEAAAVLARGGIVAFPTESSYGLGADALDEQALALLFALKGRPEGKPPPVLIASEAMLGRLVSRVPERARALMARFWPGPLTLVLPAHESLPRALVSDGKVGVRLSPHPLATALVAAVGRPLTATSANPAGAAPANSAAEVCAAFGEAIARGQLHVLDGGAAPGAPPSTVVAVGDDGALTILRAGAIESSLILALL
jgi:L-threonylcarbamoyladenylate synthase